MAKKKRKKAPSGKELENQRRELFCRYFAQNNQYFNNGTWSYAAAYGYELEQLSREPVRKTETYEDDDTGEEVTREFTVSDSPYDLACHVCAVEASKLLRNPEIQERIRVLRNEWMTDAAVDGELASVIQQNHDLGPKMQGIKEFNKLRKRVDDSPKVTVVNVDPAVQAQIDKALAQFITHDNQGNTGK